MHDVLSLGAALSYLAAAIVLYASLLKPEGGGRRLSITLATVGVVLHGAAQAQHWIPAGSIEISFLNALSLCALVVVALLLLSLALRNSVYDAGLVALPLAGAALLAEWAVPAPGNLLEGVSASTEVHVFTSVMAFGVLSIAAVYALFATLIDHALRNHHLNPVVRALPALEVLESLLFQLITIGFVLLTLSLGSGLLFINDMFAQHLAHKTVLSILAWLVFGLLLWGRRYRGWRGRTAVRLTLAGVALLILSYFGSKLVLEVLLNESWQA